MNVLVIHNPSAGMRTDVAALEAAVAVMREAGWGVEVRGTTAPGQATDFARLAAADGLDAAFAVGGDGTVNEVLNGLVHSQTALGVLPYGTANVWAKEMGLPLSDMSEAARLQIAATVRCVDVGEARGKGFGPRAFLLWCGVGFDAQITAEVEPQRALKRQLGAAMFLMVGARAAFTFRGSRAQVVVDGKKHRMRVMLALTSNAQLYGGIVRISPAATIDDGMLDLAVFRGAGVARTVWHLTRVFLGWHLRAPDVNHYRGREIVIRAAKLPVQVDGEPVGKTPVQIRIRPRCLRILVPPSANPALFSNSG